jgi:hypothetical protein
VGFDDEEVLQCSSKQCFLVLYDALYHHSICAASTKHYMQKTDVKFRRPVEKAGEEGRDEVNADFKDNKN